MKHEQEILVGLRERVAIFGGSFNPIHVGHVRLTVKLTQMLGLSNVVYMPCALPPHKSALGMLPFDLRYAFVQAAIENLPNVSVSDLEAQLGGLSYTWNVLQAWHERYGIRPLFILGLEDFSVLDTWESGLHLPSLADFIVVPRGEDDHVAFSRIVQDFWNIEAYALEGESGFWCADLPCGMALYVPLPYLNISSTFLRALYLREQDVHFLLPDACVPLFEQHRAKIISVWDCLL